MILIREDLPPSAPPAAANEARDRFPWRPPGPHSSERVIGSMPDSSNARLLLQLLQSVGVSVSISMGWLGCVLDGSSDGVPHKVAGASSYYGTVGQEPKLTPAINHVSSSLLGSAPSKATPVEGGMRSSQVLISRQRPGLQRLYKYNWTNAPVIRAPSSQPEAVEISRAGLLLLKCS
jgi:hypothetical protein